MDNRNNDPEYDKFRQQVLKRDKYRCQMPTCSKRKQLHVHHIVPYSRAYGLRTDPSNGICLCVSCHKSIYGKEMYYVKLFATIVNRNTK